MTSSDTTDAHRRGLLLSPHALALLCIAEDPHIRLVDLGKKLQLSTRSAFTMVDDLVHSGAMQRIRTGRRSSYVIDRSHEVTMAGVTVTIDQLLSALLPEQVHAPVQAAASSTSSSSMSSSMSVSTG